MVKHPLTDPHKSAFDSRPESKPTPTPEDEMSEGYGEEEIDTLEAETTAAKQPVFQPEPHRVMRSNAHFE